MILRARQGLHGYASPGALVAPVQRDRQAQPRPRRSASSTCDDAWDFEQGPVNVTKTNDGVRVVIAPPTPVDAVVQMAHLLTFGEEGRAGCPTFKPTKNSGLGLLVPVSKFDLCTPTGVGDSGQRYSMRMRIDSFPADKACQSGDITPDQPYGWAFRHFFFLAKKPSVLRARWMPSRRRSSPCTCLKESTAARCAGERACACSAPACAAKSAICTS
jgi:hypothetical protein